MNISLNNPLPKYLEPEKIARSQVWGKENIFSKGESIQIVAPSGSGKTSLVHFLCGLRNDYDGKISVNEIDVKACTREKLAMLRAGVVSFIFQDLRLFPGQSVEANIRIKQDLNPFHPPAKIAEMAARLGLQKKLNQSAGTCSYGEQQRIAIIRALQQPFDFIVMDEPFSHLDENNSRLAMDLIAEETAARGAGIILADLEPVSYFKSDRTVQL